jgi:nitroimidazol reductase NimA-like FMN-containing flavoprotein (pyridoxamine 5'-phosphate oxidase superfamily)
MNPMRRKDLQMDSQFALEVLKKCKYATLATRNSDGSPYCIPISPVLFDNAIYFHCALKGTKIDNILTYPRVCLSCVGETTLVPEHFTTEYESAVVFGTACIVTDESQRLAALRAICTKYAPNNMHQFENEISKYLKHTCLCKITIDEITGKAKKMP